MIRRLLDRLRPTPAATPAPAAAAAPPAPALVRPVPAPGSAAEAHRIRRAFLDRLDAHFGLRSHYEDLLERMYRPLIAPGATVYDIGAHAGRHARPFCDLVGPEGRVEGFEPLPAMAPALEALAAERPMFRLHRTALADQSGTARFVYAEGTPEESGLRARSYNRPDLVRPREIEVPVARLDDYVRARGLADPAFVKIDVEGAEIDLLAGARALIGRARPILSVEYGAPGYSAYGRSPDDLWDIARGAGYAVFDIFGYPVAEADDWRTVVDNGSWDWFLVPAERAEAATAAWAGR